MSVKLSGLELKEFADRPGGEGEIWEEEYWIINGQEVEGYDLDVDKLSDSDACVLIGGTLYPPDCISVNDTKSLPSVLRKWLKSRTCQTVCILVDNEHMDKLRSVIKENGWKIIK